MQRVTITLDDDLMAELDRMIAQHVRLSPPRADSAAARAGACAAMPVRHAAIHLLGLGFTASALPLLL